MCCTAIWRAFKKVQQHVSRISRLSTAHQNFGTCSHMWAQKILVCSDLNYPPRPMQPDKHELSRSRSMKHDQGFTHIRIYCSGSWWVQISIREVFKTTRGENIHTQLPNCEAPNSTAVDHHRPVSLDPPTTLLQMGNPRPP